jgi:hypothetical protein
MKSPIAEDESTDRLSWYVEALHVGDLSILALLTTQEPCLRPRLAEPEGT